MTTRVAERAAVRPGAGLRRAFAFVGLCMYLLAIAGAFVWLWSAPETDDYAGWLPTTALLSIPAVLAILADRARPGHLHASTVAIPAGLAFCCAGLCLMLLVASLIAQKYAMGLMFATLGGPVSGVVFTVVAWRYLLRQPLRLGAVRVLAVVAAANVVSLLTFAPAWWASPTERDALERSIDMTFMLLGVLPLVWALPLMIAVAAGPRGAAARSTA